LKLKRIAKTNIRRFNLEQGAKRLLTALLLLNEQAVILTADGCKEYAEHNESLGKSWGVTFLNAFNHVLDTDA
jgi:hypothetical protein